MNAERYGSLILEKRDSGPDMLKLVVSAENTTARAIWLTLENNFVLSNTVFISIKCFLNLFSKLQLHIQIRL